MNRDQYRKLKKYSREEMQTFLTNLYHRGFKDGEETAKDINFKVKLVNVMSKTKGVGDKTIEKVLETLELMENDPNTN